jgi:CDGSH-type Zn-finger protein
MANEIRASENGPYLITGTANYIDADGNEETTKGKMIALCRCGQSSNKPFCDGTHKRVGFTATAVTLTLNE